MRVLITGISGFAGSFLAEYCLARGGVEVVGLVRSRRRLGEAAHLESRVTWVEANVRDAALVEQALVEAAPDLVFHLAGQTFVPKAFTDPVGTLLDNVVGQLNVIQALLKHRPQARLLVVGSGTVYGIVRPEENPIDEHAPLRPADPYAASKAAQDLYAAQYFISHQLPVVRVRAFNHTGPRQSDLFVASRFARQVAEIEAGLAPPLLPVGNLSAVRDFTDVRDMVRAYFLAATRGEPGEVYNVGSGVGRRIDQILGILAGYSKVHFTIREDPALFRPLDVPELVCNATKLRQQTGWEPQIPLERTLLDLLDYWRARLAGAPAPAPMPTG